MRPALLSNSTTPGKGNSTSHTQATENSCFYIHMTHKRDPQRGILRAESAHRGDLCGKMWGLDPEKKEVHIEGAYLWWGLHDENRIDVKGTTQGGSEYIWKVSPHTKWATQRWTYTQSRHTGLDNTQGAWIRKGQI